MKILYTLLLMVVACNNLKTNTNISGNWTGEFKNQKLLFNFKPNQKAILIFVDTKSANADTIIGNYELDLSKKPIPLTIKNIHQFNHPLHTIIEFINKDSIKIAGFSPKWRLRPISFKIEKTLRLKRIKK